MGTMTKVLVQAAVNMVVSKKTTNNQVYFHGSYTYGVHFSNFSNYFDLFVVNHIIG